MLFATHYHTTTKGRHLDFVKFPFLKALYADPSSDIVLMCGVQSGKTEWCTCDAFSLISMGVAYQIVQPKDDLRVLFSRTRIAEPIKRSEFYKKHIDSVGKLYNWNAEDGTTGVLRIVFSNRPDEFISFPADAVGIDELDKCDINNLSLLADRMMGSDLGLFRRSSTPTTVGSDMSPNINWHFCSSDKKEYLIECESCHSFQIIDWFKNVVEEVRNPKSGKLLSIRLRDSDWNPDSERDLMALCRFCGHPLKRLREGEWHSSGKTSRLLKKRGYHLNKLISPLVSLGHLWANKDDGYEVSVNNPVKAQRFSNSVLGLPYIGSGTQITEEMLAACQENYYLSPDTDVDGGPCSMGIDVGPEFLDVRISSHTKESKRRAVWLGKVKEFSELYNLISRFNVVVCVVDAEPETREAIVFQNKAKCKVYVCYTRELQGQTVADLNVDKVKKGDKLTIDRTLFMDSVLASYANEEQILPKNIQFLSEGDYVSEMTNPTRVMEVDDRGNEKFVWTSGRDHSFLADVYDLIATLLGNFTGRLGFYLTSPRPSILVTNSSDYSKIMDQMG